MKQNGFDTFSRKTQSTVKTTTTTRERLNDIENQLQEEIKKREEAEQAIE